MSISLDKLYKINGTIGEDLNLSQVQFTIREMGRNYRDWNLEFYGGQYEFIEDGSIGQIDEEGYINIFRKSVCNSNELITDEELKDFHLNFTQDWNLLDNRETRLQEIKQKKRDINEIFNISLKESHYDADSKKWEDFDINGVFLRTRGMMIYKKNPIPHYVWKLIPGNPFDRVYRNCRDYMKWKGTKRVAKLVFINVCKWENGKIFHEGESDKEFEYPLWINWNVIAKDFLLMKTKLKKEGKGGLEWLKEEVGGYIKTRISYYEKFGNQSLYYLSKDLINKFENF